MEQIEARKSVVLGRKDTLSQSAIAFLQAPGAEVGEQLRGRLVGASGDVLEAALVERARERRVVVDDPDNTWIEQSL